MSNRIIAIAACGALGVWPALAHGQASHTASRIGDVQVGAGFVFARPDYPTSNSLGGAIYADFDRTDHLGVEFEAHQANDSPSDQGYQRTYELGLRYFRTYGIAVPFAKGMFGRGVFNYPGTYNPVSNSFGPSVANLAYNLYAFGAGSDFKLKPWLHLRAEYEYQNWMGIQAPGLKPQLVTLGLAYHFNGDLRGGR